FFYMDIFKFFFDHDIRLDSIKEPDKESSVAEPKQALTDFMSPTPTFSTFYLTGTDLDNNKVGLNCLFKYTEVLEKLDIAFAQKSFYSSDNTFKSLSAAI